MKDLSPEYGVFLGLLIISISIALRIFIHRKKFYRKKYKNVKEEENHDYSKSVLGKMTYNISMFLVLISGVYGISVTLYYALILIFPGIKDFMVLVFSDVLKELIFRYLHTLILSSV